MCFFQQPVTLGTLTIPNRVWLAPLAGITDVPFRRICQELGAGLTYVEMLSAVGIQYQTRRTLSMFHRHPSEPLLGIQVTGPDSKVVADAIRHLDDAPFDAIDINMGCSVRKVVAGGAGSGILDDPDRITATTRAVRDATCKPFTVKTRLGPDRARITIQDTAHRIAAAGADGLIIHGRTRNEKYGVPVDTAGIRAGLESALGVAIRPLTTVGNGDIFDPDSAEKMQRETGCDAIMVSRGALGNPWIFRSILAGQRRDPTIGEWGDLVLRHLDYQQEHYGDTLAGAVTMRKHLLWYIKGFPYHKPVGETVGRIQTLDEGRVQIREYVRSLPSGTTRFTGALQDESCLEGHSKYDPKYDMNREHDRPLCDS